MEQYHTILFKDTDRKDGGYIEMLLADQYDKLGLKLVETGSYYTQDKWLRGMREHTVKGEYVAVIKVLEFFSRRRLPWRYIDNNQKEVT